MSIICTICHDLVTEVPEDQDQPEGAAGGAEVTEIHILALQCGHLFHQYCVQGWFHRHEITDVGECPCCKKESNLSAGLRIWPSGDEESSAVSQKLSKANEICDENKELVNEMRQIQNILEETGAELELERVNSSIVKYEYEQNVMILSELESKCRTATEQIEILQSSLGNTSAELVKIKKEYEEREKQYLARIQGLEIEVAGNRLDVDLTDNLKKLRAVLGSNKVLNAQEGPIKPSEFLKELKSAVKDIPAGNVRVLRSCPKPTSATTTSAPDDGKNELCIDLTQDDENEVDNPIKLMQETLTKICSNLTCPVKEEPVSRTPPYINNTLHEEMKKCNLEPMLQLDIDDEDDNEEDWAFVYD